MTIEEAIVSRTEGGGTTAGTRVYPSVLPEGATLPAVVYQRIDGPRVSSHGGPSGTALPRFQFSCWAATAAAAVALANEVRVLWDGFTGTVSGVVITGSHVVTDVDDYEPSTQYHRRIVDFIIWHEE